MFKKMLLGAIALGGLSAIIGGGTFAAWQATATGTGTISAATVGLELNGFVGGTLVFGAQNLLPGETSTAPVSVKNTGSRAATNVTFAVTSVTSGDPTNCPAGNLTPVTVPAATGALAAGATVAAGNVSAKLDAGAPIGCAGVTFTVLVTATETY